MIARVDKIFAVNTLSYIYMYISSYALPALAESGGRIIAVGSAAGRQGLPRVAPYSASKHAVFGYFDSLRQDLAASKDPKLASVTITTGVLGSFVTETARAGTKGARACWPVMTDGIRIQLFNVRSFSLKIARKRYCKVQQLYSLDSDAIRQYRRASTPSSRTTA